jgi:hypothetical protein
VFQCVRLSWEGFEVLKASLIVVLVACGAGVSPGVAVAQDEYETVIVTGTRIDTDEIRAMPAITRRVPADFVLTTIACQSASREPLERRRELQATFEALRGLDQRTTNIVLSGGEMGSSSVPMDTLQFEEIYRSSSSQTFASFGLVLRIATQPGDSFPRITQRISAFQASVPLTGRAECFVGDEQMIGVVGAQQQRDALLNDIARDVRAMQQRFGPASVEVRGLAGRVQTQPTDSLALDIFIPYEILVKAEPVS